MAEPQLVIVWACKAKTELSYCSRGNTEKFNWYNWRQHRPKRLPVSFPKVLVGKRHHSKWVQRNNPADLQLCARYESCDTKVRFFGKRHTD